MSEERKILTEDEIDTIGEVLNISMGAAATAVSTMLERQVIITTPQISQSQLQNVDFSALDPAVVVKIKYIQGLSGTNVIVIRRRDMGVILDLLMGNENSNVDDYEFDEMSMSAACEVMNQMMGSSATAMSEMLNMPINISTPQASLVENSDETKSIFDDIDTTETVLAVSFKMTIRETLDTTFSCVMPLELAREMALSVSGGIEEAPVNESKAAPIPPPQPQVQQTVPTEPPIQQAVPTEPPQIPVQPQYAPPQMPQQQPYWQPGLPDEPQYKPPTAAQPTYPYPPVYPPTLDPNLQYMQYQPPIPQQPYGQPYARQMPYGQYPEPQSPRYVMPSLNVKQAEFPDFSAKSGSAQTGFSSNLNMLMGVALEVSVVIGRSKQKIKDVLELGQGSVIELDRQTGSPAEIVVNGQLIAYGDVVVVGDNFGIRITEIVGTKELIDSLEKNNK